MSVAHDRVGDAETTEVATASSGSADGPLRLQAGGAASPAGVLALQRTAGNRAAATAVRRAQVPRPMLQRLGYPLGTPLPSGAVKPKHGSDSDQRRYSVAQFETMWAAQFHLGGRALQRPPGLRRDHADEPRHGVLDGSPAVGGLRAVRPGASGRCGAQRALGPIDPSKPVKAWVLFAMLFWSNRSADPKARMKPDPKAFRPDPVTGRVDMSGIGDIYELARPGFTNFDFGFWDEATTSFWHANHGTYPGMETPQEVYQSTHGRFARKYWANGEEHVSYPDFDRVVYGVAQTTIMPEKLITKADPPVYSRKELVAAFKTQVKRGEWADAARRLNGFDDADIKKLARALTHDERTSIIGAAYGAMPGWSDRVVDAVTLVDKEPPPRTAVLSALDASVAKGDWADVALRLNGLSDDDLNRRLRKLKKAQRAAVAAAAPTAMPGWSDRVTDAIAAIDGAAAR